MESELVRISGHIIDSLTLSKILDLIIKLGGSYRIDQFHVGATRAEVSNAELTVMAEDGETLDRILHTIQKHGAQRSDREAKLSLAPADGVFPEGFHVTTNLRTTVRCAGSWHPVDPIEMDCGIVIDRHGEDTRALCTPVHRVRRNESVVVGDDGVRVYPLDRPDPQSAFGFMGSEVSTERPKEPVVEAVAQAMKDAHAQGSKVLFVGGPAIVHSGSSRYLEAILRAGWVEVLFAGNALAAHDIESALYGTSLGISLETGVPVAQGHEHHMRAINTVRAAGSIRAAVDSGQVTRGIMFTCIRSGIDYVLAGSIRDDGPLPDVITDCLAAQDAMRSRVAGVSVALMVATTLHSVATGNLLPASVRTVCVDSDPDTVIKLLDRGSNQAVGLVTDCEFFLKELAARLPGVKA